MAKFFGEILFFAQNDYTDLHHSRVGLKFATQIPTLINLKIKNYPLNLRFYIFLNLAVQSLVAIISFCTLNP